MIKSRLRKKEKVSVPHPRPTWKPPLQRAEFYDLSFPEAVSLLLGGERGVEWNQTHKSSPPRKPFALPEMNGDMRRVYAYLIKQRFIDREVITHFAKAKMHPAALSPPWWIPATSIVS